MTEAGRCTVSLPHSPVGAVLEQCQREHEVDHHPGRQQPYPLLPSSGLGENGVHKVEIHDLGQLAQMPRRVDPRCHLRGRRDDRLLLQRKHSEGMGLIGDVR